MKPASALIALRGVGLRFGEGAPVLQGLDLALQAGERVALLGPSGCGKSSALRLLAGLLQPSQGTRTPATPPALGCVFQEPRLLPWASTLDNVALPLRLAGTAAASARAQARAALAEVGLDEAKALLPHQLSGGMAMRAALARALLMQPALLLLDEPFGALDEITRERLGRALLGWHAQRPAMAVLLVTHAVFEAVALADRVLVMSPRPGRVLAELDVRAARGTQDAEAWPRSDAYFDTVRRAQQALAAGWQGAPA